MPTRFNVRVVALVASLCLVVTAPQAGATPTATGVPAACAAVVPFHESPTALAERAAVDATLRSAVLRCYAELTGADGAPAAQAAESDPLVCPILQTVALVIMIICVWVCRRAAEIVGSRNGVLEIDEEGDVFLLGDLFYDCPPYDALKVT